MKNVQEAKASEVSFNEAILRVCAAHRRGVSFRYAKTASAPIELRAIVPVSVALSDDGNTVVIGEDQDRAETRAFRLDRIKGDVIL